LLNIESFNVASGDAVVKLGHQEVPVEARRRSAFWGRAKKSTLRTSQRASFSGYWDNPALDGAGISIARFMASKAVHRPGVEEPGFYRQQ
jgi:hypothetical protein